MNYFPVCPILVSSNKNNKIIIGFHYISLLRLPLSMMIEEKILQYDTFQ